MSVNIEMLVFFWLMCGVLSWGIVRAYFVRRWPAFAEEETRTMYVLLALAGPIDLLASLIFLWKHRDGEKMLRYGFLL